MKTTLLLGDCREILKTLEPNSIDSMVTDPPAFIDFMGKSWDSTQVLWKYLWLNNSFVESVKRFLKRTRLENGMDALNGSEKAPSQNHHPTVKSTKLMSYLIKLITQPGGLVLDPFMGSGSTGVAAIREGFKFIGIEREKDYFEIAESRVRWIIISKLMREESYMSHEQK